METVFMVNSQEKIEAKHPQFENSDEVPDKDILCRKSLKNSKNVLRNCRASKNV